MRFLSKEWSEKHLEDIKNKAGKRYSPELNIELPISEIFDGLGRTKFFYIKIRSHYGKLSRRFKSISNLYENKRIQPVFNSYSRYVRIILDILQKIKNYDTGKIPWNKIGIAADKALAFSWKLSEYIRAEKEKPEQNKPLNPEDPHRYPRTNEDIFNSDLHAIVEMQKELRFFIEFSKSTSAKISNNPFLLLTGTAGSGKTHLLCDLAKHRIKNNYAPTLLSFGEFFQENDNIWQKMGKQFRLTGDWDREKILKQIDRKAKNEKNRSILMIDALNESRPLTFWKKKINKLCREIRKYSHIGLIVTIRSGFEQNILNKSTGDNFIKEEHKGFEFREWEAVTKFFKEFSISLPEVPLISPEFQNPLFLLLFCKAFGSSGGKPSKKNFKGHEGATHIFEEYIDSVSKKIEKKFGIDHGPNRNIWDTIIEKIAEQMVEKRVDRLYETDLLSIIQRFQPTVNKNYLLDECEKSFLLVKVPHYNPETNGYDGFDYRFPFQRFSDHLIGRFIFKKYEKEFGRTNKNLTSASKFFSKKRKLGKTLESSASRGVVEALFIQCPEQINGVEFFEVAPYIDASLANDAFLQSIIWREPRAFSLDRKKTLEFINEKILPYDGGKISILNTILSVATIPSHPFNSEFLHQHLNKMKMPTRDAWWSTYLHSTYGHKDAVDRILKWSWSDQELEHLSDNSIFLIIIALTWFLSTPNRFVRDKATMGIVNLLQNRLNLVEKILEKFENIDDPYITERLLASIYGCVLRNNKDTANLKTVTTYLYKRFFSSKKPPTHILIRDYARGIIEAAHLKNVDLDFPIENTKPPYKSSWPTRIPSVKAIKKKYYPDSFNDQNQERGLNALRSSVLDPSEDFSNYVIDSHLGNWSGRKLKNPKSNKKEIYKRFKKSLTREQKKSLDRATNRFFGIKLSNIMFDIKTINPEDSKKNEAKGKKKKHKLLLKFKETLPLKKARYFETEIEPFLNDNGSVNDPYERFDTSMAKRWIFNRVLEHGYSPELHGNFDGQVNYYSNTGRSSHKAERIGKKYQWIAYHEFAALLADHYELADSYSGKKNKYLGPWHPYFRDIDPSFILQNDEKIKLEAEFSIWKKGLGHYRDLLKEKSDHKWLQKESDLPDPRGIVEIKDDKDRGWLTLKGIFSWQQETIPEQERYDYPVRDVFYILKSFIVKKKNLTKITNWVKGKGYGNWLPESSSWYETFIGEFPKSSSFKDTRGNYNIWVKSDDKFKKENTVPVVVTDDNYINEFTLDCSRDEGISLMIPSKFLVEEMNLKHTNLDGRFYSQDEKLVIYATSVSEKNNPSALIANKEYLIDFLKRNNYAIFWTLLGEKRLIGGDSSGKDYKGRLDLNGVYYFSNDKLEGSLTSKFNRPK